VAITGAGGSFPGARDLRDFWRRVSLAQVAALTPVDLRDQRRTAVFRLAEPPEPGISRQTKYGHAAIAEALHAAFPDESHRPDRSKTALVLATTGAPESYFAADVAAYWHDVDADAGHTTDPADQVGMLAEANGIHGVRITVDTACASSLYAVEFGMNLLTDAVAEAVVVLGLNIEMPDFALTGFGRLGALSPSGAILPFSGDASGLVLGEAAAAIVLELADRPERSGRRVMATVAGIGLSSDGAERSVFAPGVNGQLLAYERAYGAVDPRSVGYVEAHGTATMIGDTTELESLDRFFGPTRDGGARLPVGSVKALVGHCLAASGLVSITKVLDVLESGRVPPHVPITPNARLGDSCLDVPTSARPLWRRDAEPSRVGISSFGFGGSNAHLVLERGAPRVTTRRHTGHPPSSRVRQLRLVDFEVAMGDRLDRTAFTGHDSPVAPPSPDRFPAFTADDLARLGAGSYFPAEIRIPAGSLRMGPRMIARIDPLQVLASQLTDTLVRRHLTWIDSARTAIALASNLGGEMALRISRQSRMPPEQVGREPLAGDLELEHIASGMPSMCSGYPASAANLRGFHATFGGAEQTFLRLLGSTGHWLDRRADAVIVGAARSIISPLDARRAPDEFRGWEHCEAVGLFLFARPDVHATEPLADLSFAFVDGDARAVDRLRHEMPCTDSDWTVCELAPDRTPAAGRARYLGPGSGMPALLLALTAPTTRTGIDFRHGGRTVALAVVSRRADAPAPPVDDRPRTIAVRFGTGRRRTGDPVAGPHRAAMPVPVEQAGVREFLRLGAAVVERSIRHGVELVAMATTSSVTPVPQADDTLLTGVRPLAPPGRGVTAGVRVDTGDPYFFDHPLDHVPAVLLFEAAYRLAIRAGRTGRPPTRLDMSFLRFCDLDAPITLDLRPTARPGVAECHARQNDRLVAKGRVQTDGSAGTPVLPSVPEGGGRQVIDPARVHKANRSNVFLDEPRQVGPGRYRCEVIVPAEPHVLLDGSPTWLSPTVLIEAFRQMSTFGAHELHGVHTGQTMTQVSFHAHLDRPIRRGERIALEMPQGATTSLRDIELARLTAVVSAGGVDIGVLKSSAFLASIDTYARLRKG
jgi:3-oxoacyl-(acyl-carrier-protein) synthase